MSLRDFFGPCSGCLKALAPHRCTSDPLARLILQAVLDAAVALGQQAGRRGAPLAEHAGGRQPGAGAQGAQHHELQCPAPGHAGVAVLRAPDHDPDVQAVEEGAQQTAQEAHDNAEDQGPRGGRRLGAERPASRASRCSQVPPAPVRDVMRSRLLEALYSSTAPDPPAKSITWSL